jgi:hypothetical protein
LVLFDFRKSEWCAVQSKLEQALEQKEKELKFHQRFLNLKSFCEDTVFPTLDLPLGEHISNLAGLIERLIPDPRDRKEEMFSGEIFALLGTVYLHDMGLVKSLTLKGKDELFAMLDRPHRSIQVNNSIGARLDIPAQAIEIINYLSLSDLLKKYPMKWEIEEDGKKAIIRNTKVLQYIFNFSHLILDVFYPDLRYPGLRRYGNLGIGLCSRKAGVDIDSREGVIRITYRDASPYELHHIKGVKSFVDGAFQHFKGNVNGRLGLHYRQIKWDITGGSRDDAPVAEKVRFSPYGPDVRPPLKRWEEASAVLDKMFGTGKVLVVGEKSSGKTTLLTSFVLPQILCMVPNTFYCEIWKNPVHEIRDVICGKYENFSYSGLDITSICNRLLDRGPCVFLLDSCERVSNLDEREREKFARFLEFCFGTDRVYLIVSGEKESFFDWFGLFEGMELSAIYDLGPVVEEEKIRALCGRGMADRTGEKDRHKPAEYELSGAGSGLNEIVEGLVKEAPDPDELRSILACFIDVNQRHLERFTMGEIRFETSLPQGRIVHCLYILKKGDFMAETHLGDSRFLSLSNRCLKEPLHRVFKLAEFDERRLVRAAVKNSVLTDSLLSPTVLAMVRRWKDRMQFSKEGMGLILTSLISGREEHTSFLEKANSEGNGIDIQPLLRLVYSGDVDIRREAITLLAEVQDKNMINPLLRHLRKENVQEIRDLLVKGMGRTGKRKTMIAIVQALREIGDSGLRLKAIEFFCSVFDKGAKTLLLDIAETEEDPTVLQEVRSLLSTMET